MPPRLTKTRQQENGPTSASASASAIDAKLAGYSLPATLLIVDDSPTDRFLLSQVIRGLDPEVEIRFADSLAGAREMLGSSFFGAILLDLHLPDADELEGLHVIADLVPTTPIVVVSAYPSESFVHAALNYGADEYLNKNELDPSHVRDILLRAVGRREGRRHYDRVGMVASRALNVMSAPSVILDQTGRVVASNDEWVRSFDGRNPAIASIAVGDDYLAALGQAVGDISPFARDMAAGLQSVLLGREEHFAMDYPVPLGGRHCWFNFRVVPLSQRGGGAVVTHFDITGIRGAEEFVRSRHSQLLAVNDVSFNFVHNDKSPIFVLADADGVVLHSSPTTTGLLGTGNINGLTEPVLERVDPQDAEMAQQTFRRIVKAPLSSERVIVRVLDKEHHQRTLDVTITNLLGDPAVRAIAISGSDITQGRIAQIAARIESRLLQSLPTAVVVRDIAGVVVLWNHRASLLYGYTAVEAIGKTITELGIRPEVEANIDTVVLSTGRWEGDLMAARSDGSRIPVHATIELIDAPDIEFKGFVGAYIDVSERRQLEELLIHQAHHDPLTGLPNRRSLTQHLDATLSTLKESASTFAVLSIDFDDFGSVNERFGHPYGDAVLRNWVTVVEKLKLPDIFLAHLGEDEFVICCPSTKTVADAVSVAQRILDATGGPIVVGVQSVSVTASIGIAMAIATSTPEGLLRNSSLAMYSAKEIGRGHIEIFDDDYHEKIKARNQLRIELSRAVQDKEIEAYFQPEVSLQTGEIIGFEALARWNHADRGQVSPAEFIPLAEESGIIGVIGAFMLEASCLALREWESVDASHHLTVAINVSVLQLADPLFPQTVKDICQRTGVDPTRICLEVTESSLIDEVVAFHALSELKATGVLIALDDFGTGYSSLLRLNRYPLDFLKIDQSFVAGLTTKEREPVVVTAVLAIAKALGIGTIGEGIESGLQWERLRELGCDTGQGYLFSKAVTLRQATSLISSRTSFKLTPE
jgi:diguanylate cyclase (GGDEF)-like protein/PAS domain S-box-containing protein